MHDDEEERDEDTRSHEEGDPTTPRLAYNSYLPCRLTLAPIRTRHSIPSIPIKLQDLAGLPPDT